MTPSTSMSTLSGFVRWSSVMSATPSTLLAAPTIASRKSASEKNGPMAMSVIGSPQNTTARPKIAASRRPRGVVAPTAPMSPPTPIAAVRYPTSASLPCNERKTTTTIRTLRQPRTNA
jgi:hypothetical protein